MEALQFEGTMTVLGAENLGKYEDERRRRSVKAHFHIRKQRGRTTDVIWGMRRPPETRAFSTHVVFVGVEEGEREREGQA